MIRFIYTLLLVFPYPVKAQFYSYGEFSDSSFVIEKFHYTEDKLVLSETSNYPVHNEKVYVDDKEYFLKPKREVSFIGVDSIKTYNSFVKKELVYPHQNLNIKINFGFYIFISETGEVDDILIVNSGGDKSFRFEYMDNALSVVLKTIHSWSPAMNNLKRVNSVLLISIIYNGVSYCNCREPKPKGK